MTNETSTETTDADTQPSRWPKHAIWIGLTIAFVNLPFYFGYITFASSELRDVPWINAPFSWLGLVLAAVGTFNVFKQRRGMVKNGVATIGLLLTLFLVGLFNWYVFSLSYSLPASAAAPTAEAAAPEFTLRGHDDQDVSLVDLRGDKVVLVFYRGYW